MFELQALDFVVRTSILTLLFLVTAVVIHVDVTFSLVPTFLQWCLLVSSDSRVMRNFSCMC